MTRRTQRVGNLIRNTIGQLLLTKLSDPRIDPVKTSITRVEVPDDLMTARVYISVMGTDAQQKRTLEALTHAAGHIQELMMRQFSLRHTPALEFVSDTKFKNTLETYAIIERAMQEIRQKEHAEQGEPEDAPDQVSAETEE